MDLAVLIVGFIMGFVAAYFTVGPGKEKMNQKKDSTKPGRHPVKPGSARPRRPVWADDEEDE